MRVAQLHAGYWLLISLGVISIGLIGMMIIPTPRTPACLTDGSLQVRLADTVWVLPENEASVYPVRRRDGFGHVCEPPNGEILAEHLSLENVEPSNVHISIAPYRGGNKFTDRFEGSCHSERFITASGKDLGHQCNAYRSLGGTVVRCTYYSAHWPSERWPELFQRIDRLLAERRVA